MSAAEFAVLAERVANGTATREDRAAYGREIAAESGIAAYSLAMLQAGGAR